MATSAPTLIPTPRIGFGDRLRRLRLDLGLDLREFGEAIDVSHSTLSRFEASHSTPRNAPHVAASIQLRYGASSPIDLREWLLSGAEIPSGTPGRQTTGSEAPNSQPAVLEFAPRRPNLHLAEERPHLRLVA